MNSEGSFQCVCEAGYRPTPDRGACVDVNECSEQRVCRNGRCHNTPGSFRCECLPGFTLSNDGRTCLGNVARLARRLYKYAIRLTDQLVQRNVPFLYAAK